MASNEAAPARLPLIASLTAGAISQAGNSFTNIAIPWYVLATTGSAARMGIVGFVQLVPTVVSSVFGGALVDRVGHKRIAVLADVVSGLSVAAIPLINATIGLQFWQLLVLVFLGAAIDAPGSSARSAILPDLIELSGVTLERANGVNGIVQNVVQLTIPPLAGIAIAVIGASQVLWIDAGSFFISAIIYTTFVPAIVRAASATEPYLRQVYAGLRFLRRSSLLLTLVCFSAFVNFFTAPLFGLGMAVLAKDSLGGSRSLGWMLGALGAGSLISLLLYSAKGQDWPRRTLLIAGFFLFSAPLIAVAVLTDVKLAIVAMVICGIGLGPINPITGTVLQERIPPEMRGRVFGSVTAAALVAAPLGFLVIGSVVDRLGAPRTVFGIGVLLTIAAIGFAFSPSLRAMDEPVSSRNRIL